MASSGAVGDALKNAGFEPNMLQGSYPDNLLLDRLAGLCRELGKIPTVGEMKLTRRIAPTFPNAKCERFGLKSELVTKLGDYCRGRGGLEDVLAIC